MLDPIIFFCIFFGPQVEVFTVLHNDPAAPPDHCGRCRIRTRDLLPLEPHELGEEPLLEGLLGAEEAVPGPLDIRDQLALSRHVGRPAQNIHIGIEHHKKSILYTGGDPNSMNLDPEFLAQFGSRS